MRSASAIALLCTLPATAQVLAELDTNVLRIGEHITLSLRAPLDGSNVEWPTLPDSIGPHIEVLRVDPADTLIDGDIGTLVRRLTITSFDTGFWAIPPFVVRIDGRDVPTAPLLLEVRPMPVDSAATLRPMRGLHEAEPGALWYLRHYGPWVAGLALAAALLLLLFKRLRQRPTETAPVEAAPPGLRERMLTQLRALEAEELWQQGRHKEYHARLTDLLRGYLEERYAVPALERTTAELMHELAVSPLTHDQRQQLRNMLELADLVKFAKAVPSAAENEAMMIGALRFVMDTAPEETTDTAHAPRP